LCSGEDMIMIREERREDEGAIQALNEKAFGQPAEANIVDKLRKGCPGLLSLVALDGDEVVGHILFSPARIEGSTKTIDGMGLAPMAVLPERQRQGHWHTPRQSGHRDAQVPWLYLYHRAGASGVLSPLRL